MIDATAGTRARPLSFYRPFAKLETFKQAKDAAALGAVGLLFQGIRALILTLATAGRVLHPSSAAHAMADKAALIAASTVLGLTLWVAWALVRRQAVWASYALVVFAGLKVLEAASHGPIALINIQVLIPVLTAILGVRGARAAHQFHAA